MIFFIWILNDQHFYYISHNIIQIHTTCKRLYLLGKKEKKNYVLCSLAVLMLRWYIIFQTCRHIFFFKKYIIFLIVFFKDCDIDCNRFFWKKIFWLLSRIFSSSARPFSYLAQIKFRIFLLELLVVASNIWSLFQNLLQLHSNEIIPIFIALLLRFFADFRTLFVEQELLVVVKIWSWCT